MKPAFKRTLVVFVFVALWVSPYVLPFQALGVSLARGSAGGESAVARGALERAEKQDPSRLVRDTAADALAQAARPTAKQLDQPPPPPLE